MRWGDYPGNYPGGPNIITRVLTRGRERFDYRQKRRRPSDGSRRKQQEREDATLLALKVEEGAMTQGMQLEKLDKVYRLS